MSQNPKEQHFVPRVYLKQFSCDKHGNLYRLDFNAPFPIVSPKFTNVSRICWESDFYTIETPELLERYKLSDPYFIEKNVFNYENKFIKLITKKMINNGQINLSDSRRFIKTILDIKRRNPSFRRAFHNRQLQDEILQKHLFRLKISEEINQEKFLEKGYNISGLTERVGTDMRERLSKEEYRNDMYREGFLEAHFGKEREHDLIQEFASLKFYIFKTDRSHPFITSDNPGFTITTDEKIANTGFSSWHTFAFPLNPFNLFMILKEQKEPWGTIFKKVNFRRANKFIVDYSNKAAIFNCNTSIFSNEKSVLNSLNKIYRVPLKENNK